LEGAIQQEQKSRPNTTILEDFNSPIYKVNKRLHDKQLQNRKFQETNSQTGLEILEEENEFKAAHTAQRETINTLQTLINRYESQYVAMLESLVISQGGSVEMIKEHDKLKEVYFSSLLLRSKLHYQLTFGYPVDLLYNDLYTKLEGMEYNTWHKAIDEIILKNYKESITNSNVTF